MIVKSYKSPECSQSVTVHPNGDQAHSVILLNINGEGIALMGYVIKNGKASDTVIIQHYPRTA